MVVLKGVFYRRRKLLSLAAAVVLAAGLLAVVLALGAQPARAAFPGENGKIAFASWRGGIPEILTMNPDGSEQTSLGYELFYGAYSGPVFSPDGTRIAFASDVDDEIGISVINADGTDPTFLYTYGEVGELAFSPDGKKIAFSMWTWGDGVYPNRNYEIYVMNADGTGQTRLTDNPSWDDNPTFSPDGEKIAFSSNRDGDWDVWIMNVEDGSEQTDLTANQAEDDWDPTFSPDGKKVSFASSQEGYRPYSPVDSDVYVMNSDGTDRSRLTNESDRGDTQPAFSPDGTKIAFARGDGTYSDDQGFRTQDDIYVMNADGTEQTNVTNMHDDDFGPNWGPAPEDSGGSEECTITGTEGNDVLQGTSSDDVICGLGGNDSIKGLQGNDTLLGGEGKDTLKGGLGDDALDGGAGTDAASYGDSVTGIKASLVTNAATGEGTDTLEEIENLTGSHQADELEGSEGPNRLQANGGADTVLGLGGADVLYGWSGRDTLKGGSGADKLTGGSGADKLFGEEADDALNSKDGVNGNDSVDGGAGTNGCTTDPTEASIANCQ